MKKHVIVIGALCAMALSPCTAQVQPPSDLGASYNLEFSKKIATGLSASLEWEYRTRNNLKSTDRFATTIGLNYKLADFVKVGADYTLINLDSKEHKFYDWEIRHRWSAFVTLSKQVGRVNFTWREKYQQTYRNGVPAREVEISEEYDPAAGLYLPYVDIKQRANPKKIIRSRLQGSWDIKNNKFEPYASIEVDHLLNDPVNDGLGRVRYTIGTDYKLSKKDKLTFFYRYNNELTTNRAGDEEDPDAHYIGIGYSHKF